MTVDRGGLRYGIDVEDRFSASLSQFVTETDLVRSAWRKLKAELAGTRISGAAKALERLNRAQARSAQLTKDATAAERRRNRALSEEERVLKRVKDLNQRLLFNRKVVAEAERQGVEIKERKNRALTIEERAQRRVTRALEQFQIRQRALRQTLGRHAELTKEQTLHYTAQNEVIKRIERAEEKLATARAVASSSRLRQLTTEEVVLKRIEQAERRRLIAAGLAARGFNERGEPLPQFQPTRAQFRPGQVGPVGGPAARRTIRQRVVDFLGLSRASDNLSNRLNRVSFTFRRLIGIIAAFTAARLAFDAFTSGIRAVINYRRQIEQTRIGLKALILSTNDVADANGNVLSGSERFNAASRITDSLLRKIRVEAAKSVLTFEELSEAVKFAAAPLSSAKVDVNQNESVKLINNIATAARSLQVQASQLREEITAVTLGLVNPRTTRLVQIFGQSATEINRQIKEAREQGNLVEFLNQKLQAFSETQADLLETIDVASTNAKDAILQVTEVASSSLIQELIGLFRDLRERSLIEEGPNPAAVAAFRELFDGLSESVAQVRRLGSEFQGLSLSNTLTLSFKILGGLVEGILRAVSAIADVIDTWASGLLGAGTTTEKIVALATEALGIYLAWTVAVSLFNKTLLRVPLILLSIISLIGVAFNGAKELFGIADSTSFSFVNNLQIFSELLSTGLSSVLSFAFFTITQFFLKVVAVVEESVAKINLKLQEGLQASRRGLVGLLQAGGAERDNPILKSLLRQNVAGQRAIDRTRESLRALQELNASVFRERRVQFQRDIADLNRQADQEIGLIRRRQRAQDRAVESLGEDLLDKGFQFSDILEDGIIKSGKRGAKALGESLAEAFGLEFDSASDEAEKRVEESREKLLPKGSADLAKLSGDTAGAAASSQVLEGILDSSIASFQQDASGQFSSNFVNALLLDAEDENKVVRNFKEFFQNINKRLKQISLKDVFSFANITRYLLAAFLGANRASQPQQGTFGGVGFASGGKIPSRATPSPAHFFSSQGFAFGGRPAGLDPRDTVPVWARPGEWFMRLEAVRQYGSDVMARINAGLVDPSSLQALAATSGPPPPPRAPRSFAHGGTVTQAAQSPVSSPSLIRAVVVSDEESLQTTLAGGEQALLEFMRENSDSVRTALGV